MPNNRSNNDTKFSKTTPVFRIKPLGTNRAVIKHVGYLNDGERLGDEVVELDKPTHPDAIAEGKNVIPIKNIGDFTITGRLFRCNIVGAHIIASRRYPLMYLDIHYDRTFVSGSLLQIFFSLDMNWEEKKAIKNNANYVNLQYSGKWYMHIDCDDEMKENFEKFLLQVLEDDALDKLYNDNNPETKEKREKITEDDAVDLANKYVKDNRTFYDELMKEKEMEFKSIRKTRDMFVELCQSEKFYNFLKIAMKCREIYRRKQAGIDDNDDIYVVPKKITKIQSIQDKMISSGELIIDSD